MYQQFWPYAIFVIVSLVSIHYLADNCMTREFGQLMLFLSYLVISYIVATSMRHTVLNINEARERSVRLSFDSLIALFLLVTGYSRYGGRLLSLPGRVIETGVKTARKVL